MEKTCETCMHFRRHYVKYGFRYDPIAAGHCVCPRRKLRWEETPACRNYKEKPGS
ncbi:MAG: hypothetical protein Q4C45_04400 [Oscillospiraceae bacterium]|nr:hypothetical protein [Oscillospiraceae bacterium]